MPTSPTPPAALPAARLAVSTLFLAQGIVSGTWAVRIPSVQARLGVGSGALGLALAGAPAGVLLAVPLGGMLIGRFGSRRVAVGGALLMCAALPLPALVPSAGFLALALLLIGAGGGVLDVGQNVQAVAVEEAYARPLLSTFHGVFSVGAIAGAAAGGAAEALGVGARPHLLAAALVTAAAVLLAAGRLLPLPGDRPLDSPAFRLPSRPVLLLGAIAFCGLLGEVAIGDWSAVFLRGVLGAAPGVAAAGYACFAVAMAVGRLSGDRALDRLGAARTLGISGVVAAAGVTAVALSPVTPLALAGFAVTGIGIAVVFPAVISAAGRRGEGTTSASIAGVMTLGYVGTLIEAPMVGLVARQAGLRAGLGLVGLIDLAIAVGALPMRRVEVRERERVPGGRSGADRA
ncbi:MAG TPA: MFS transporter [Thermomicrobiaceae bacterium]|nr:MFS transporter [Thermomicrobiaceae bacterium]